MKSIFCPYCGGKDFVEAYAASIASISKNHSLSPKKAIIIYKVCTSCGTIAHLYVRNPKDLL